MSRGGDALGTVARVAALLRVLAEAERPLGVKEAADALGLPASTTHRLLDLLISQGLAVKDEASRRYGVGLEWVRLAHVTARRHSLEDAHAPLLAELTRVTGETAVLGLHLPAQGAMMFAAKSESPSPLRYRIDLFQPVSLAWGASGHAILAFLPPDAVEAVLASAGRAPASGASLDRAALRIRLAEVRAQGYAISRGEKLPGAVGVAAPLVDGPDAVAGSIALTIPELRFDPARGPELGRLVARIAARTPPADVPARKVENVA